MAAGTMRDQAQDEKRRCSLEQLKREERAARGQLRREKKMRAGAERARDRQWRERLANAIRETRAGHKSCRCELRATLTREELRALGSGCTAGRWVCPRLDAVRRRLGL